MATYGPSSTFAAAWTRFQGLTALRQVEDTLEADWTRGRSVFLAFLAPAGSPDLTEYVAPIGERLAAIPGVEPYPPAYWHVTVKGIGFEMPERARPDEFSPEAVAAIAAAAETPLSGLPAIEAQVGPVSGFDGVVFMEVHDAGAFADMNTRLVSAVSQLPPSPFDAPNFLPHISIARFISSEGLTELKQALNELRALGPGPTLTFERIDFIRAHLSAGIPTFETIASYPMGPA